MPPVILNDPASDALWRLCVAVVDLGTERIVIYDLEGHRELLRYPANNMDILQRLGSVELDATCAGFNEVVVVISKGVYI